MLNNFLGVFRNKITLTIIQGLSGTVGFGILFIYGYSSKAVFTLGLLLCIPFLLSRIAMESKAKSIGREHPKMTISSLFTFLAIILGFVAGLIALIKMDRKSFQAIMESKPFLVAFYLCFISGLIADATYKPKNIKNEKA